MDLKNFISITPDFPKEGISFKDISPLLADKDALNEAIEKLSDIAKEYNPTIIIGPEARGFIFGPAIASKLGVGFVMARKKGKLPGKTIQIEYQLEYGTDILQIPMGLIKKGDRVLLIDDLLATGGTVNALARLVSSIGATPVLALSLIELTDVIDQSLIGDLPHKALISYRS